MSQINTARLGELSKLSFWSIALQVAGLFYLITALELEYPSEINQSIPYVFGGFLVHSALPLRLRLPFFVCLTIGILCFKIGLIKGAILVGISLATISICHLPISMLWRILLLLLSFGVLITFKVKELAVGTVFYIFPIYGSIFMFRSFVYLYATELEKAKGTLWQRLGYFFMLPNLFFFLFPIIDYTTYLNTYYNKERLSIYQNGVRFLAKGIFYLLVYRFVYYFLIEDASQVTDVIDFTTYIISGFFMVLRLVGIFHLCIGILCLFGFNLPNTFGNFLLAPNLLELWRRINIYWREFLIKLFYYPLFVKLKKKGWSINKAIVVSSLFTFFMTWQLHSWQFFWISGHFPISLRDLVYWGFWGTVITYYTYQQTKAVRKRGMLKTVETTYRESLLLTAKVIRTFLIIALVFSFWTSNGVQEWFTVLSKVLQGSLEQYLLLLLFITGVFLVASSLHFLLQTKHIKQFSTQLEAKGKPILLSGIAIITVMVFSTLQLQKSNRDILPAKVRAFMMHHYNHSDQMLVEKGYYEEMLSPTSFSRFIQQNQIDRPEDWKMLSQTEIVTLSEDLMQMRLLPSKEITFKRKPLRTNQWAMVDEECQLKKPDNTIRIAILGGSPEMGGGVNRNERFDYMVEQMLNEKFSANNLNIELLNFSVETYTPIQKFQVLENKAIQFQPDMVVDFIHDQSPEMLVGVLATTVKKGWEIPFPFFDTLIKKEGINSNMTLKAINKQLCQHTPAILQFVFDRMKTTCKNQGIPYYIVYSPYKVGSVEINNRVDFTPFIEEIQPNIMAFSTLYKNYPNKDIALAPWDDHPNELGHQLLADVFYKKLTPIIFNLQTEKERKHE